ncbi:MAG: S41 family peptidase [Pseudomonadota bacterium]
MLKLTLLFLTALLTGCAASSSNEPTETGGDDQSGLLTTSDPALQAIWYSAAYGELIDLRRASPAYYEVSGESCVAIETEASFIDEYFDKFRLADNGNELLLSADVEPYEYRFIRLPEMLAACRSTVPDTPAGNFQVFTDAFSAFYPFFDRYDVSWTKRVAEAGQKVEADMPPRAPFTLFREMLAGLRDAHVELVVELDDGRTTFDANPGKTERGLFRRAVAAGQNPMKVRAEYRRKFWRQDTQQTLLGGAGVMAGDEAIQFGIVSDDIGMIALLTMGGFIEAEGETESEVLERALDEAMALFEAHSVKAVIVNLAMNYGGYDYISRQLARRFARESVRAYSKISANDPDAKPFWYVIEPAEQPRFTGPVYLLTSDVTVSAGEIATLAMRPMSNVTHVGETTRGALSDVLSRSLPNGWELSLSSEIYRDHEDVLWEARGIPPKISIPVFDPNDPLNGYLDAVSQLVKLIDGRHPQR